MLQLLMLVVHLTLLRLHSLTLCLLIGRILADEGEATIHLRQVLGAEDEHQLILHRMMTTHIAHSTDILVLAILQLLLQGFELSLEDADVAIDVMDVLLDALNVFLSLVYLAIQNHEVFQTLLHVSLILSQRLFLFLDFLLDGGTLPLQASDVSVTVGRRPALRLGRSLG